MPDFCYVGNSESEKIPATIKVIGVGGAGGNAINSMIEANLQGVNFIVANTDIQSLNVSKASTRIQLGAKLSHGLGAGANPERGKDAALESEAEIRNVLSGSNMVFITAGLGGGTGTGASPVIAKICKEMEILTVAVVTKPFSFEGRKRIQVSDNGLEALRQVADTVITIPNNRLRGISGTDTKMIDMFRRADEILHNSVKGISDLIYIPGYINLDFADVQAAMSKSGMALMGIGISSGDNRAIEAAERAISHPLLEDISISGAKAVLMNISSNRDVTMEEVMQASDRIHKEVGDDAEIFWGTVFDDALANEMRVTVIATGIGTKAERESLIDNKKVTPLKTKIQMMEMKPRGVVRDYTEEDQAIAANCPTEPVLITKKANSKYRGLVIDNDVYDIPTFLRRKAD
ncbi:MAG: cell division protein FtsZ [Desulfobacterales bacterium]|nr:cell division protein FtsZ [Desulfobacterales bacterium]